MKTTKLFSGFLLLLVIIPFHNINSQWLLDSSGMGNRSVLSFAVYGNNLFAGTLNNGVYLSNDSGTTWAQTSFNSQNIWTMAVSGTDIFAATDNDSGVYKSTNNGGNWVQTLNNQSVWSLLINGSNIFAGTENNGVFLSTNAGVNWAQTSLNFRSVHAIAANGNNIFAGTFMHGVYYSSDNGTTWIQTSLGDSAIVNALAVSGNNIFAGTQTDGVYLSTNNGTTWAQTSLNSQYVRSLTVSGANVFAGIQANGVFISNNNGTSWIQRNEGLGSASVDALLILNNFIFAGTEDGSLNGFYKRPLSEIIGIKPISGQVPEQFQLFQNYPNPFNPTTKIRFALPRNSLARIIIYDMLGREIETIVNQQLNAGTYEADWSAGKFSSGIYYYRLTVLQAGSSTGDYSETKKMVLIK